MEGVKSCEAQRKFWGCPELVEMVFPFLDTNSILSLCQVLPAVVKVVQGKTQWNKLIRRTCNFDVNSADYACLDPLEETTVEKHAKVMSLAKILALMENPSEPLLDLLDLICERHKKERLYARSTKHKQRRRDFVQVSCSRHGNHSVSPAAFMLLEEVESALEWTEEDIECISLHDLKEPFLSAFTSRISRRLMLGTTWQKGMSVNIEDIYCKSKVSADAIATLVNASQEGIFCQSVNVDADIGREGWTSLKEALSRQLRPAKIFSKKSQMARAGIDDVRTIWAGLSDSWTILLDGGGYETFQKRWDLSTICKKPTFVGEKLGWKLLEEFLKMTERKWVDKYPKGIMIDKIRSELYSFGKN